MTSLFDIKMSKFIKCLEGDREGITEDEWLGLYSDYISARDNEDSRYILELMKEISYMENKFFITAECIKILGIAININAKGEGQSLVDELKSMGYKGKYDWSNPDEFRADLKAATSASKRAIGLINRRKKELEDFEQSSGKEMKREDFEKMNVDLSRFMGFRVDNDVVSAGEWCAMMNKYDAYCEIKNAEKNNLIRG